MLFWDRGGPHKAALTKQFLKEHQRLETHFFPGYSPELNPDEWVWSHLKRHELAGYAPHHLGELKGGLRRAVMRMRVRPSLIRSFTRAAGLKD